MSIYLVKDNITVDLSPTARVEEQLVNDLFVADRGISPSKRNETSEATQKYPLVHSAIRNYNASTHSVITSYPIYSVTGVFNNAAHTGTNYYLSGGSFDFKTITLGTWSGLDDGDRMWISYVGKSGDTIAVDAGKVRNTYVITGNLISNSEGSLETKKDFLRDIFNLGGNVALTFPSQNDSQNIFPTRLTFVNNAGECEQSELIMEAVRATDKR